MSLNTIIFILKSCFLNQIPSEFSILLIILFPILCALIEVFRYTDARLSCISVVASSLCSVLLLCNTDLRSSIEIGNGFIFSLDKFSQLFIVLVNLSWVITSIYSIGYLKYNFSEKAKLFRTYLSLSVASVLATGLAENMFTLIFFYTISGLLILPLLTKFKFNHQKISLIYSTQVLSPPLLTILPVSYWLGILTTPFDQLHIKELNLTDLQASLLLGGFILFFSKNCIIPFHMWLPKSSFAPAPVSALIHTVGAVQTGTIAILKISHYVYGESYLSYLSNDFLKTGWITYLCGTTALYTAYRAWRTTNLKERFSFSTVGQVSYILTAILVGTPASNLGAILHVITHSLAKMTLFFNAGIFSTTSKSTETYEVAKIAPTHPWLIASSGIAGLSITGFPFLAGYYSKDLMLIEEIHTHHYAAAFFLLTGSIINFLYIFPIIKAGYWPLIRIYILKKPIQLNTSTSQIPISMALASAASTIGIVVFSHYIYFVSHFFEKI